MEYNVNTPAEYINAVRNDNAWRLEKLESLRALIRSKAPEIVEDIKSNVLRYSDNERVLFYLHAQKNHVGLYVGDVKTIDADGKLLNGIDVGKGCIRFKKSVVIADTRIEEFVEQAVALWQTGVDFSC